MENLLRNNYTVHYGLAECTSGNITANTNISYFELNDDTKIIYKNKDSGVAKYNNPKLKTITAINYENFVKLLHNRFKNGRNVCDLIVVSDDKEYFLLNELTDTLIKYVNPYQNSKGVQIGKRTKAKKQLSKTLDDLLNVPDISAEIKKYQQKRCCFFNKKSMAPNIIEATKAFGRINRITSEGFNMSNTDIESKGFQYYEYSGEHIFTI